MFSAGHLGCPEQNALRCFCKHTALTETPGTAKKLPPQRQIPFRSLSTQKWSLDRTKAGDQCCWGASHKTPHPQGQDRGEPTGTAQLPPTHPHPSWTGLCTGTASLKQCRPRPSAPPGSTCIYLPNIEVFGRLEPARRRNKCYQLPVTWAAWGCEHHSTTQAHTALLRDHQTPDRAGYQLKKAFCRGNSRNLYLRS